MNIKGINTLSPTGMKCDL